MPGSLVLTFHCRLASVYHSTQHIYRNLLRCAPYILGSSLRGLILSYLIQTSCSERYLTDLLTKKSTPEIQQFHRSCPEECLLHDFAGGQDWLPIFSFGEFKADFARGLQHRVAIDRQWHTVATGKIVSVEVVPERTEFQFSITLPISATKHKTEIEQSVRHVGRWIGLGRYKSIGFGRFEVERVEESFLSKELDRVRASFDGIGTNFRLRVLTHLVLHERSMQIPLEGNALGEALGQILADRTSEIMERFDLPGVAPLSSVVPNACRISFRPDYISRNNFEEGQRKNALVALPGSWLDVSFDQADQGLYYQLAVAEVLGTGPWADVGFGRLKVEGVGGGDGQPQ